ncbi:hypothetical protein ABW21_db0203440 [Orbilia brochopaga]|nr:hypothetical protein ABW21_db0203440 [Drechslerella brochopaga]
MTNSKIHEETRGESAKQGASAPKCNFLGQPVPENATATASTQTEPEPSPRCSPPPEVPKPATEQPKDSGSNKSEFPRDNDLPFDSTKYQFRKEKPAPLRIARLKAENSILKSALKKSRRTQESMTRVAGVQASNENSQSVEAGPSAARESQPRPKVRFVMPYRYSSTENSATEWKAPVRVAKKKSKSRLAAQVVEAANTAGSTSIPEPVEAIEVTSVGEAGSVMEATEATKIGQTAPAGATSLSVMENQDKNDAERQSQQKGTEKMQERPRRRILLTPAAEVEKQQNELKMKDLEERMVAVAAQTTGLSLEMKELTERVGKIHDQQNLTDTENQDSDDECGSGCCLLRFLRARVVCWIVWTIVGLLLLYILMDFSLRKFKLTDEERYAIHWFQINAMKPAARKTMDQRLKVYFEGF